MFRTTSRQGRSRIHLAPVENRERQNTIMANKKQTLFFALSSPTLPPSLQHVLNIQLNCFTDFSSRFPACMAPSVAAFKSRARGVPSGAPILKFVRFDHDFEGLFHICGVKTLNASNMSHIIVQYLTGLATIRISFIIAPPGLNLSPSQKNSPCTSRVSSHASTQTDGPTFSVAPSGFVRRLARDAQITRRGKLTRPVASACLFSILPALSIPKYSHSSATQRPGTGLPLASTT